MQPTGKSRKLSASVPLRWGIGPNGLCPRAASVPAPSFRGRPAKRRAPSPTWLGSPIRLHCTAAWPSAPWAAVLFRHCGPLGPLGGRLPGPGAFRSPRRPPAAARRIRLLASGLASPWAASAPRPPPWLCSVVGGPGPGLWAPEGPGVVPPCGALCRRWASAPSGCFPRPLCRLPRCLGLRGSGSASLPPEPPSLRPGALLLPWLPVSPCLPPRPCRPAGARGEREASGLGGSRPRFAPPVAAAASVAVRVGGASSVVTLAGGSFIKGTAGSGLDILRGLWYICLARPVPLLRGLPLLGYPWTAGKPLG